MDTIAFCGLDCSKCDGLLATKSEDKEELAKVAKQWSVQFNADIKPEHVICDGCMADGRKSLHCQNLCEIRKCAVSRKLNSCGECADYPCGKLSFILDNAPQAKENLEKLRKKL